VLEIFLWTNLDVPLIPSGGIIPFTECFRRDARYIAHVLITLANAHLFISFFTHGGIQTFLDLLTSHLPH